MKTDLPLKRITQLRPQDILAMLGLPDAEVIAVEMLEMPTSKTSLDTLLRVRLPDGTEYLHLIEWQGWHDEQFLWRVLGYVAWLGQNRSERPIVVTIIYLSPEADVGETLTQHVPGQAGWSVTFSCVKLWQLDAAAALTSGLPAVVTLAPLMQGATEATVEEAAQRLLADVVQPTQAELLTALGVFAEPIFDNERFVRLVTKERLMSSSLVSYLFKEKLAEFDQQIAEFDQQRASFDQQRAEFDQQRAEFAKREASFDQQRAEFARREATLKEQLEAQEQTLRATLQQTLEDTIAARFPTAPMSLLHQTRTVNDPATLQKLINKVLLAPDLATVEQALAAAQPTL
ncbi:MAG: hypothetical protein MUD01_02345 [Chloroflexaceae bacterium]|jgi:hypothetical protein|nr:hypothetical protein [Chloroflexaceae bacterium]